MTTGPQPRVLVAGSVSIDENRVEGRRYRKLGGVPTYAGLTYVREGLPTSLVANAAAADAPLFEVLASEGLHVAWGATDRTTRFVNHTHGAGRRQRVPATATPIAFPSLAEAAAEAAWVHLGPLHPDDLSADVYDRLAGERFLVVLDLQGLARCIRDGRVIPGASPLLPIALRAAAVVKTSQREQQVVLGALGAGVEELMDRFEIAEWVSTAGAQGGCIHVRGGGIVPYPPRAAEPLDPTGAGDVFLAAYAAARLGRRAAVSEAAGHAAAVAARQIAGRHIPFPLLRIPNGPGGRRKPQPPS